ncbi:alpha/beta fold hydrolase [Pseudonocardia sp. CA-107938]|uniref:alpha/beta fold hydrolase n=1 Tax=Pseudonocardia sp. CA-107938 TaxID=3240021 RepID=UPI003D8DDF11
MSAAVRSRYVRVDDIRTHYLEAGSGHPVVLLHSGEYGACGELSWEYTIDALAQHFHVIAPDWLGFGGTDKIYDFETGSGRRFRHMARFLETIDVPAAFFVGSSMGGSVLSRIAATDDPVLPIQAMVLSAGGGFVPANEARAATVDYECTPEAMRRLVEVFFHDPKWAADEEYIRRRYESSIRPGQWEATAAARFRSPLTPPRQAIGQPDRTPYENIRVPTLVIAGADDKLREPGYADEIAARIPDSRLRVYDDCGHLPHIENAAEFNADVIEFLLECQKRLDG